MKTGIALFALLTTVVSVQAQEYDDMYFKSKDRAKLNGEKVAVVKSAQSDQYDDDNVQARINPTDSYSGRGVNPEYTSRSTVNSNDIEEEDAQYFVSGYQPTGVNQTLTPYNSSGFNTPYYGNSAFSNSYYGYGSGFGYPNSGFYSPYSSFYSPYGYGSSFGSGFYSGMSLGMGYMWGGMGSGFYESMGYGNMWGSPYYNMWDNYYYGGWGNPYYGWGGYGYPTQVVVINNNNDGGRGYVYGKRGSRSSSVNNQSYNGNNDSRGRTRNAIANTGTNSGGRSATTSQSQYYQSGWRNNPDVQRNIVGGSNSGRSSSWSGSGSSSSWRGGSNNGSGWNNSNSGGRSSWDNNGGGSNNSGSGSFGGRSGGSVGGGSTQSSGGSRGRH